LQSLVAKQLGFKLADHRMELYGDCTRKKCPNLGRGRKS
jgi:Fe2+ or Zn2+ uptake regulation protein